MATGSGTTSGTGSGATAAGTTGPATVSTAAADAHKRGHDVATTARSLSGHTHDWVEQGRYIPYSDVDFDAARQQPEQRRDEDGKGEPLDAAKYTTPKPYVYYVCDGKKPDGTPCLEVKRVEIPEKAYKRLVRMLGDGRLLPEHLSQLPLRELVPELAEQEGRLSGAQRITIDPDEED